MATTPVFGRLVLYLRMIKFSHSIFALPFAFTSAILAYGGIPALRQVLWITVAMVGARSAAMGMNRVIDRKIDALNPRTKNREIPLGVIGVGEAAVFIVVSLAVLVYAAYNLNYLCFKLSPLAIGILFFYSFTKRFTWLSHVVLGVAISFAPIGAWIAVKGTFSLSITPLVLAVVFWLAGFDTLYGLNDLEFDKQHGLFSIPRRFGKEKAIMIARGFHILTWALLILNGLVFELGLFYYTGIVIVTFFLFYEHYIIKPNDLSRLNMAFFNMNGYISVTIFVFVLLEKTLNSHQYASWI
ncbi:MAG: UbiA family prenyltransferase [Nitrospirae bacterium]|nr:UbiA family prenyltransferase [Nitrospirota bacterium]